MANNQQKVDSFINRTDEGKQWHDEFVEMRRIALASGLTEDFKWGHPCYTLNDSNVVLIHGFKNYCAYLFHKGVLLKDEAGILVQQTENVQSARQIRFTSADEIIEMEHILKAYIEDAIEVEKSGKEVEFKETEQFEYPDEFIAKLEEMPELQEAFESLTPGRQRGYLLYFSGAKQSKTRTSRVEKYIPHILDGKGLDDK